MARHGQLADKALQERLAQHEAQLLRMREEDLRWVLSKPQGRRWFWLTFSDEFAQDTPTESNVSMTLSVGVQNFCRGLHREASRVAPAEMQVAFQESLQRAAEERLRREKAEQQPPEESDNG